MSDHSSCIKKWLKFIYQEKLEIPSELKRKTSCNFFRNYRIQYHRYYPESSWEDVHAPGINKSTFSHRNVCNAHHTAFCMSASNGGRHGSGLEKHWVSFFPVPRVWPGRFSRGPASLQMVEGLRCSQCILFKSSSNPGVVSMQRLRSFIYSYVMCMTCICILFYVLWHNNTCVLHWWSHWWDIVGCEQNRWAICLHENPTTDLNFWTTTCCMILRLKSMESSKFRGKTEFGVRNAKLFIVLLLIRWC